MYLIIKIPIEECQEDMVELMNSLRDEEFMDGDCQHWTDGHVVPLGDYKVYIAEVDLLVSNKRFVDNLTRELSERNITHETIELTYH